MATPYGGPMPTNPYGQPQMPDWMNQPAPLPVPNSPVQVPDMSQTKRRGMFGAGGGVVGDAIIGALNGYLAGLGNPAGQLGLQQLHQKRMLEQQEAIRAQEYQQQRQDKRDDFTFEQDYRAQHPGTPDIIGRVSALNNLSPGLGDTYARNYANNGGGLGTIFKDPATGQSYAINPQAASGPQPGTVEDGYRFKGGNPSDPNAWEPVQGGPTPQALGGFPGPH